MKQHSSHLDYAAEEFSKILKKVVVLAELPEISIIRDRTDNAMQTSSRSIRRRIR